MLTLSTYRFLGLVNGIDVNDTKLTSQPPLYTANGGSGVVNGHVPQNYYLTGEGGDPSPSGSNETAQSDLWMMKSEMITDAEGIPYHPTYATANMQMDPNCYTLGNPYSYYPHEDYHQLSAVDDTINMNMKNTMCKQKLIIALLLPKKPPR